MIIQNNSELLEICNFASKSTYIAFDTEFSRKKGVYYPIPSLIQFCFDGKNAFICDLYINDINWSPLIILLQNPAIIKIFHAVKNDIEVLYKAFDIKLNNNIFDMQMAAMFLEQYSMPSYDMLVKDFLNESLDKSMQYSDWKRRPLSNKQLVYAASDVIHLYQLLPKMQNALGVVKYNWAVEEMDNIIAESFTSNAPKILEKLILRIISLKSMTVHDVCISKCIVEWRENQSLMRNMTREAVLDSQTLELFIMKGISHNFDITKLKRLNFNLITKNAILSEISTYKCLESDLNAAQYLLNKCIQRRHIMVTKPNLYVAFNLLLDKCSVQFKINKSIIATKNDILTTIYSNSLNKRLANGWRYEVFGQYAEKLLCS